MLHVQSTNFSYGDHPVLRDLTFSLPKGQIGALIGPSGVGKSTIFKLITGLIPLRSGKIVVNGTPLPEGCHDVAYMMQEDLLLPWRTVLTNMTIVAELGKKDADKKKRIQEEARYVLNEMGLAGCDDMFPNELSGGMRQRVSLARALLQKRPLLLLDEPFGPLDVSLREQLYAFLREIQVKFGTTMLMVTHDFRDALSLADHVYLLDHCHIAQEWEVTDTMRNDPALGDQLIASMRSAFIPEETSASPRQINS